MRRKADRAVSPQLREIYMRIAADWEHMAAEECIKESKGNRSGPSQFP